MVEGEVSMDAGAHVYLESESVQALYCLIRRLARWMRSLQAQVQQHQQLIQEKSFEFPLKGTSEHQFNKGLSLSTDLVRNACNFVVHLTKMIVG